MYNDINLHGNEGQVLTTVKLPRTYPSIKIIIWQHRVFLKDSISGSYYEEKAYLAPMINNNQRQA